MSAIYKAFDYPQSSELNPSLLKIVRENLIQMVSGGGYRTGWKLHERGLEDINILLSWISELIPKAAYVFANKDADISAYNPGELGYHPDKLKIQECWGIHYNKGEGVISHNHFPYTMTACYYVNVPEGSAPIIMEGEEIHPVAGRVVFFPGHQYHEVMPTQNKADGRCAIPSNIVYSPH